jgi:hypothetical protein
MWVVQSISIGDIYIAIYGNTNFYMVERIWEGIDDLDYFPTLEQAQADFNNKVAECMAEKHSS